MKQDKSFYMLQIRLFRAQTEVFKSGDNASFFKQFGRGGRDVRLQM